MSNSVTYNVNGIDRTVRVISYNGTYQVEVQYDVNDLVVWVPIDAVDDWRVCDDAFLQHKISEADLVVGDAFGIEVGEA